jgi:biotin carboxyl carrier protein
MTTYAFTSDPAQRHQAFKRGDHIHVDSTAVSLRALNDNHYVVHQGGTSPMHVRVAASGDTLYLQLGGRACAIERVDPTRSHGASGGAGQGSAVAPMPGVVVSWVAKPGSAVAAGDALVVIESMKLQMTIEAPQAGTLEELPVQPGQTFQRGAVLARVRSEETSA